MAGGGAGGFGRFAAAEAGVVATGLVLGWLVPAVAETRLAVLLGVAAAGLSGALALWVKKNALAEEDTRSVMRAIGFSFAIRGVTMVLALAWVLGQRFSATGYVFGFFGVYFAQQVIEIAYVLAVQKGSGLDE